MNPIIVWSAHAVLAAGLLLGLGLGPRAMVVTAADRLEQGHRPGAAASAAPATPAPAVADHSEDAYCSEQLKTVLRRVLTNCGLIGPGRRGCQPGELRNVAQISDEDFNALFQPLQKRGGIVLFEKGKEDLDESSLKLIEDLWSDRRGASYFFVVGRASTDGRTEVNRALSHRRVNSVLFHLQKRFSDPELEQQVGLLWLGEEYAQLGTDYCNWRRSRGDFECNPENLNRSTFLSWIDCRL